MKLPALALLLLVSPAAAQVKPTPGTGDPRLQTVRYDAAQVVQLTVASGYQLMVALATDERVETIAVGDSAVWQVTANKRGDALFVKAVQPGGDSNLTVITDARIYGFDLVHAAGLARDAPFIVRFTYAEPAAAMPKVEARSPLIWSYRIGGDHRLRPSAVTVDGDRLAITWPKATTLPATFRIDDDGAEALVNGQMQDGRLIVDGTPLKLLFRLDRHLATATRVRQRERR